MTNSWNPLSEEAVRVMICRRGMEDDLLEEAARAGWPACLGRGEGWLVLPGVPVGTVGKGFLVFERQRMDQARGFASRPLGEGARQAAAWAAERLDSQAGGWTLQAFAPDPAGKGAGQAQAAARRWREELARRSPNVAARESGPGGTPWVVQLCLTEEHLWCSVNRWEQLASTHPGGAYQAPHDPAAPSRSYLKMEEALDLLADPPRHGQKVVDLGAAPGGWSYAFLKRGCRVLAVDRGPLKISGIDQLPGQLTHLREDGLTFTPPKGWLPADWLVSDMLVAPGQALGLFRRWVEERRMKRFVINVKLPQKHPAAALMPLEAYLAKLSGRRAFGRLRQLYHDRREVTLVGRLE
ncbi:MAG: hypothetical protein OEV94_02565 [Deltaproteobacteria bacterium]|nr:hypothetical protein [Deltaproteobacteria bacterium]